MIKRLAQEAFLYAQECMDQFCGVDFSRTLENHEIGISIEEGNRYQATTPLTYRCLHRILAKVTEQDAIIDVGCGKGRMLKFFSKFGFRQVDGLELSPLLCQIAENNMKKLGLKCQIINENAITYSDYDTYNYFYFFNPIPHAAMVEFINNLNENLKKSPRKVTIIYMNPVCKTDFFERGFYEIKTEKPLRRGLLLLSNQIGEV